MPWVKTGRRNAKGKRLYRSPSGKLWAQRQIAAYKATKGFARKPRKRR